MRFLLGFLFVCALALDPLVGCSETVGTGGSSGSAGSGATGGSEWIRDVCEGNACPCTEAGIRAAIETGGDEPYTFDCNGSQTVAAQAEIVIDNDVILDGEDNLTIRGDHNGRVLSVEDGAKAELHRLTATHGHGWVGGGIANEGTLTIDDCVISENRSELGIGAFSNGGGGIYNSGEMTIINSTVESNGTEHSTGGGVFNDCFATLMLRNSTIAGNGAGIDGSGSVGGGIMNHGEMTIINSTVSGNSAGGFGPVSGGGIVSSGWMSLTNSTVSGNRADSGDAIVIRSFPAPCGEEYLEVSNTLIDGDCDRTEAGSNLTSVSRGHNIESPGNSCGLNHATDQYDVSADDLNLGPLADNGGPSLTHALLIEPANSVAIDVVPEAACIEPQGGAPLAEDQRGVVRPQGEKCDVGAFELE